MIEQLYDAYLKSHCVTTDSRNITPGCIFFAFKGERFDGNAFARQALEEGAALCVVSDPAARADSRCLLSHDVLLTLQQLAAHHRRRLAIPVIGITGTNGKTTTKELTRAVLGRRYRTFATQGNFNNHLGVPLTVLAIPRDAEMAIVEMGASHPGEIESLCRIADPDYGLITNVGRAHLEGFGSFEGVVRTKTELYRHLAAKGGTAFVCADNAVLVEQAARCGLKAVTYGAAEGSGLQGHLVGADPYLKFYVEWGDSVYTIQSQLLGGYNFDNAMAAAAVGQFFHVDLWDVKEAVEEYAPANKRSQYKETGRNALFIDCYNANPSSMKAALDSFVRLPRPHKVAMLGGMRELGADSEQEHRLIVKRLLGCPDMEAVLVGPEFRFAHGVSPKVAWFPDVEAAVKHYTAVPLRGATVLLKGSNGTRMWLLEETM